MIYRFLEKQLGDEYTCENILNTLKEMNFASIQGQMKTIQKKSKKRE